MMKTISIIAAGLVMLGLASCDNRPDIVGQWQGTLKDAVPQAATSNVTVNYSFSRDGSTSAAYDFEFYEATKPEGELVSPYQLNVAGTASVQGTWQYVDREDDEVAITYDMSTLQVNVDPDAVVLQSDALTGMQEPQVDSLKTAVLQRYTQIITSYLKSSPNVYWDDVEVKKPILKYEVDKCDRVLQQVTATPAK